MDIDAAMRRQCTHVTSQARGDILVRSVDLEITEITYCAGTLLLSPAICY